MNRNRKDFTRKKKLKDGKRLDTGQKRMNENAFIQNTMKRFSFDNKAKFVFCKFLFRHTTLLQRLHSLFYKNQ